MFRSQGSLARSARSILRRRAHGLCAPDTTTNFSSKRTSTFKSSAKRSSASGRIRARTRSRLRSRSVRISGVPVTTASTLRPTRGNRCENCSITGGRIEAARDPHTQCAIRHALNLRETRYPWRSVSVHQKPPYIAEAMRHQKLSAGHRADRGQTATPRMCAQGPLSPPIQSGEKPQAERPPLPCCRSAQRCRTRGGLAT